MAEDTSILVIAPRWVGDMVMAQCLFSALRELFPDAAIDVMAPSFMAPLVRRMPEITGFVDDAFPRGRIAFRDRLKAGRAMRGRYSHAYVMQGNWKSALIPFFAGIRHRTGYRKEMRYGLLNTIVPLRDDLKKRTAEMFFNLAGGGHYRDPRLDVDTDNQARLFAEHGLSKQTYAALMPGAEFGPSKRWPSAHYAGLASKLAARGLPVVLLGSPKDSAVAAEISALAPDVIDLTGKTALDDAIDILAGARISVTNDSGLMHIAAAVGTPVVAVYGSTSPHNTPPLTQKRELPWLELDCSPCHKRTCPLGHMNCMNRLDVERVAAAADRLLAANETPA